MDKILSNGGEAKRMDKKLSNGDERPEVGAQPPSTYLDSESLEGRQVLDRNPESFDLPKIARGRSPKKAIDKLKEIDNSPLPVIHRKSGRQPNTPERWTSEFILKIAAEMERYTDESEFPTESEFCYIHGVHPQRFSESAILSNARDMMMAKRQAVTIKRGMKLEPGEGALGSFLARLSANAGVFSLVDKQELTGRDGMPVAIASIKRVIVDDAATARKVEEENQEEEE